jgi:hypothetical protein
VVCSRCQIGCEGLVVCSRCQIGHVGLCVLSGCGDCRESTATPSTATTATNY